MCPIDDWKNKQNLDQEDKLYKDAECIVTVGMGALLTRSRSMWVKDMSTHCNKYKDKFDDKKEFFRLQARLLQANAYNALCIIWVHTDVKIRNEYLEKYNITHFECELTPTTIMSCLVKEFCVVDEATDREESRKEAARVYQKVRGYVEAAFEFELIDMHRIGNRKVIVGMESLCYFMKNYHMDAHLMVPNF